MPTDNRASRPVRHRRNTVEQIKPILKTAAIALGVVWLYHNGTLNFVPGFKDAKK